MVLTFVAPAAMGAEWRIGIDATEPTALVSNGAFALVRNPIFTAMIIAAVGLTMIVPNVLSIVGLVSFLAAIELQVRFVEDPHLRRLHGNDYTTYVARVGRFTPHPPTELTPSHQHPQAGKRPQHTPTLFR